MPFSYSTHILWYCWVHQSGTILYPLPAVVPATRPLQTYIASNNISKQPNSRGVPFFDDVNQPTSKPICRVRRSGDVSHFRTIPP